MEEKPGKESPDPVVYEAVEKKGSHHFSALWVLPIIVIGVGIWLLYHSFEQRGKKYTIIFESGEGIEKDKTQIKYNGIEIGQVHDAQLNQKGQVVVTAYIRNSDFDLAQEGTVFWLVSPHLGVSGVSGLETIMSGPFIGVHPGTGPKKDRTFVALKEPPPFIKDYIRPLRIVLLARVCDACDIGAPIYYRKVQVGEVTGFGLAKTANHIYLETAIEYKYAPLVRTNTKFWNASGIRAKLGLTGVKIQAESILAILEGGIAFATPDNEWLGEPVENGAVFKLHDSPEGHWLKWNPKIELPLPASETPDLSHETWLEKLDPVGDKKKKRRDKTSRDHHHKGKTKKGRDDIAQVPEQAGKDVKKGADKLGKDIESIF